MKRKCALLAIILAWPALIRAEEGISREAHPDSASWERLFLEDLSNAIYPRGAWLVQDGVLTATEDQCIWTKKQYRDFILDLEFKNAPGTNSGVIVYANNIEGREWVPGAVEVQILDDSDPIWADSPKTWRCAAIFGHLAPAKSAVKKPGEWNRMTITCQGPQINVLLNGETVTEMDMRKWTSGKKNPDGSDIPSWIYKPLAEVEHKGHIGFQGKHGNAPIFFRNIKLKTLGSP